MIGCCVFGLFAACSEDSTGPVEQQAFTGILETSRQCQIIGGDTTDFQPRPLSVGAVPTNYSLIAACPNPTSTNTSIKFQIPQPDSVWLLVFDRPGGPAIDTLFNRAANAGVYSVQWVHDGPDGVYRVVMGTASGFESYGDVQFDQYGTPASSPAARTAPLPRE